MGYFFRSLYGNNFKRNIDIKDLVYEVLEVNNDLIRNWEVGYLNDILVKSLVLFWFFFEIVSEFKCKDNG